MQVLDRHQLRYDWEEFCFNSLFEMPSLGKAMDVSLGQ